MKKVAINASGGGSDIGTSGNGIIEKDMTLNISKEIKKILESKGIDVLLLRDDDSTISYDDRIKKLKDFGEDNEVILISNALNSGGERGIEVIYPLSKNNTLASSIANNLEYFNDTKFYQYRWPTDTSKDYYYITRNTSGYETIIIRYGYVDNSKDATIIKNDYKAMAEAVADAILDYIGANNDSLYIVKSGDTLYSIAKKHNTTVDEIKKINNLTSNTLSIGMSLKLPSVNKQITQSNPNTYIVKPGDTLYSIAKKYNLTVDKLKEMNNKKNNMLSIGEILVVASNKTITIKSGDTLYSLAKKYNTTVDEIKKLNNLNSNILTIGNTLYLP